MKGAAFQATAAKIAIRGLMIATGVTLALVALTEALSLFNSEADKTDAVTEAMTEAEDAYKNKMAETQMAVDDDITFRNITIENNAARLGQAVALHTQGDRLTFVNCRILGNQYVCSGEMDEQAYYRIHAEHQKDFVITWDKGFRRSNITNIEGLEISE